MPFITVDYLAPLTAAQKRSLQERCAQVVLEHMAAPPSNVRVFLRSFAPEDLYVASGEHATGLPVVRVEFLPGRTLEQKRALVDGLARVVSEGLGVPVDAVRTILYERQKDEWARGARLVADV